MNLLYFDSFNHENQLYPYAKHLRFYPLDYINEQVKSVIKQLQNYPFKKYGLSAIDFTNTFINSVKSIQLSDDDLLMATYMIYFELPWYHLTQLIPEYIVKYAKNNLSFEVNEPYLLNLIDTLKQQYIDFYGDNDYIKSFLNVWYPKYNFVHFILHSCTVDHGILYQGRHLIINTKYKMKPKAF